MFTGLKKEDVPVLCKIYDLNENGWSYFKLDNADCSLFPYEQEVLLRTGSKFTILKISEKEHQGRKYSFVQLIKEFLIIKIFGLFNMHDFLRLKFI